MSEGASTNNSNLDGDHLSIPKPPHPLPSHALSPSSIIQQHCPQQPYLDIRHGRIKVRLSKWGSGSCQTLVTLGGGHVASYDKHELTETCAQARTRRLVEQPSPAQHHKGRTMRYRVRLPPTIHRAATGSRRVTWKRIY